MTPTHRILPWLLLLVLAACDIAVSETPVLVAADGANAQFKNGLWTIADHDCSYDPAKPIESWPECADWVVFDHNRIVRQRDNNVLGLDPTMIIAAGKPMILQLFSRWKDGETPLYTFAAIEPTSTAPTGQIAALEAWVIECQARPSSNPDSGGSGHYAGFDADCRPASLDALRHAAAASRADADIINVQWVRAAAK